MPSRTLKLLVLAALALLGLLYYYTNDTSDSRKATFRMRPLAEFEPVKMIMISELLLNEKTDGLGFINAIQKAGADVLMLKSKGLEEDEDVENLEDAGADVKEVEHIISQVKVREALQQTTMLHGSYWLRDFGPIQLDATKRSGLKEHFAANFVYVGNEFDDTLPLQSAIYLGQSILNLPIQLDGGNFLTNGESCLLTDDYKLNLTREKNSELKKDIHADLRSFLSENIGCQNTIVIESAPHPHIDMWAKFLNKETLLVADIPEVALEFLKENLGSYDDILKIKIRLDEIAEKLSTDFKVERLPMPMPTERLFRSYTNSILVNNTAIIPSYRKNFLTGERYIDDELLIAFEVDVESIYRRYGYKVVFLPADDLIKGGGAWRCVSIPIFKLQDKLDNEIKQSRIARFFNENLSESLF